VRCAIVGSGLAALAGYATLRHGGVEPDEITVFGTDADPIACWRSRATAIRQQGMRSESDGHLAAPAFPGLALREVWRRGTVRPLVETVTDRYHPSVPDFVRHAEHVIASSGWSSSFTERRVERVRAVDDGFELDGEGPFAHVLLATGHPGLRRLPGTVHAYEPHEYAAKVAIVGAGMAAATEWLNALAAGSEVVSVRRREPVRRPLNVPRPMLTKRGLGPFHRLPDHARAATLRELTQPSYPPGRAWDEPLEAAAREGRFVVGAPEPSVQMIAATGFERGYALDPLLADLVDAHELPTFDRWLVLADDSTVPTLTDERRTLSVAGAAGQWAFPAADTIAGAKYATRAFLRRVCPTR
jgi:cation diffusion facilitator CzcD-associated flavoprotein CzcO